MISLSLWGVVSARCRGKDCCTVEYEGARVDDQRIGAEVAVWEEIV